MKIAVKATKNYKETISGVVQKKLKWLKMKPRYNMGSLETDNTKSFLIHMHQHRHKGGILYITYVVVTSLEPHWKAPLDML